jgi:hypothetical protein
MENYEIFENFLKLNNINLLQKSFLLLLLLLSFDVIQNIKKKNKSIFFESKTKTTK